MMMLIMHLRLQTGTVTCSGSLATFLVLEVAHPWSRTRIFRLFHPLAKMLVGLLPMKQGVREGRHTYGTVLMVLYVGSILLDNLKRKLIPTCEEPLKLPKLWVGKPISK